MKLNVSAIQHFSTGDGPGIRTTVFLKGCNLRCPWCHNPETWSPEPQTLNFPAAGKSIRCGRYMTVDEVVEEVLADRDFYTASGGSATISGGEALLQADGAAMLAARLKEQGVPVIFDTAADVPFEALEKTVTFTDCYFIDLKAADAADYRRVIHGDFDRVCGNIRRLVEMNCPLHIRIPLIPGFNTSPVYVSRMAEVLRQLGVTAVDPLPFHRLGSSKYTALGIPYAYAETEPPTQAQVERIAEGYRPWFHVTVERS